VGFVVDKVALGQVFSKYFGFPCKFSFHRLLHTHHHLSSGAGKIGQLVADVSSALSLTPLRIIAIKSALVGPLATNSLLCWVQHALSAVSRDHFLTSISLYLSLLQIALSASFNQTSSDHFLSLSLQRKGNKENRMANSLMLEEKFS
jgi:hypothetical protein